jgi:hypothetical protein
MSGGIISPTGIPNIEGRKSADSGDSRLENEEGRRSSSGQGTTVSKKESSASMSAKKDKKSGEKSPSDGKEDKKEKDRLAKYLASSKRRASRPFRRAKTLLDSGLGHFTSNS